MKFAVVCRSNWDDVIVSRHSTRAAADTVVTRKNAAEYRHYAIERYRVIDVSQYRIAEVFGRNLALPK